jgi:hypothetical protein
VAVKFKQLPADVGALAAEAYEFFPDVIDQHFGCFAESSGIVKRQPRSSAYLQGVPPKNGIGTMSASRQVAPVGGSSSAGK